MQYAFGLGFAQVAMTNALFAAALLPPGEAIGTRVLEFIEPGHSSLVQIRSVLEAVVISYSLSLSSSAFALQLLQDKARNGRERELRKGLWTRKFLRNCLSDTFLVSLSCLCP